MPSVPSLVSLDEAVLFATATAMVAPGYGRGKQYVPPQSPHVSTAAETVAVRNVVPPSPTSLSSPCQPVDDLVADGADGSELPLYLSPSTYAADAHRANVQVPPSTAVI